MDQGHPSIAGEVALPRSDFSPLLVWEGGTTHSSQREFSELCRAVKASGLMGRKPITRWARAAVVIVALAAMVAVMVSWPGNVVVQILNSALLAFVFMHIGFLMHDAGHRQILRSPLTNRVAGLLFANLLLGVSYSWWVDKHNRHHRYPNNIDLDPDVSFAPLAFSPEQARAKKWPWNFIVRYQALLFLVYLLGEHGNLHVEGINHVLRGRAKYGWAEGILLLCHHLAFFGIVFTVLRPLPAIAFFLCGKAMSGIYAGLVFAPNHKGMPTVDAETQVNWFRQQVLTSRNIRPGAINDFLYGGLNYQIEHHLFPFLRQDQLAAARAIVKPFCLERGLRYHETGILRSLKEIFQHLHEVGLAAGTEIPEEVMTP